MILYKYRLLKLFQTFVSVIIEYNYIQCLSKKTQFQNLPIHIFVNLYAFHYKKKKFVICGYLKNTTNKSNIYQTFALQGDSPSILTPLFSLIIQLFKIWFLESLNMLKDHILHFLYLHPLVHYIKIIVRYCHYQ